MSGIKYNTKRALLILLGWTVLLLGIVMIPAPGPGWAVVFIGLSILARELTWAHRLHEYTKRQYQGWRVWFRAQPRYIKILFSTLSVMTFVLILWLINAFWFVAYVLQVDAPWLASPFVR